MSAHPATYRGWSIERDFLHHWQARHPQFDPDNSHDNRVVAGRSYAEATDSVDTWIEEFGV